MILNPRIIAPCFFELCLELPMGIKCGEFADLLICSRNNNSNRIKHTVNPKSFSSNQSTSINLQWRDNLLKPSDIDASNYGLFLASAGHASLIDYPDAKGLQDIASKMYKDGAIISAVCHGGAIFPGIKGEEEKSVISGKQVTGFTTKGEEEEGVLDTIKSWKRLTIEASAGDAGAMYVAPPGPWEAFTTTDGRLVTGANPASAEVTAKAAVEAFEKL